MSHIFVQRKIETSKVFFYSERLHIKTLLSQTTFGELISLIFFEEKFQDKADKWSFLFSLEIMLKGKRDGVNR